MVAWQAAGVARGDPGDQVGAGAGGAHGGAQAAAEDGQGRRLRPQLAGEHGLAQGAAVGAEA